MVDVEKLTDAELRSKLTEFGYPIMPITGTTRKLMVKKLKILTEGKSDARRSLGRYSSEEESDTDVKNTKRDKNRRITMAAPSRSMRNSARENNDLIEQSPNDVVKTTKRTTSNISTKLMKTLQDEFDTGSDSDPEIIENNGETNTSFSPSSQMNFQHSFSKYSRPQTVTSQSNFISNYSQSSSNSEKPVSSSRYASPVSNSGDAALDSLTQIRSRLSLGNTSGFDRNRPIYASTPEENVETPFLSNFTRRLSQLSKVPKKDYDYRNDVIKEHDTNGAGGYARNFLARQARPRDANFDDYSRISGNKNLIPLLLVGVACLFFVVVGVMYYGMRNENAAIQSAAGYFIPRCNDLHARPGFNCIQDVDIEDAINLMRFIKPELLKRAVTYACDGAVNKPFLTENEVINLQRLNSGGVEIDKIWKQLANMEVLTFRNPEWGISMVKTDGGSDLSVDHLLNDMEELVAYRKLGSVGLAVLHPDLSLRCRFYNKLHVVFNSLVVIITTFLALYLLNLIYKYVKLYNKQKKDEVYNMVRRIIDTLETNSSDGATDDFLVINHVRDMLLPIKDRKQMEVVWNKAVKFINNHESRVRTEIQVIQGEPFDVWRWLGNPNLNASGSPRSNTWQGQAFETQVGSVNSLPCSPTPCLKVRGMMDDNDRNLLSIREAILSKCAHQCRILHCVVDSTSKCVYLKCADQNDAAVAYRNLHGWWYSGHLVTVKYLRLERYMQRFPDSPSIGPPFLKSLTPATDWSS